MSEENREAVAKCVGVAQGDTGGASAMRKILLSMYNAAKWPLDVSEFRRLDSDNSRVAHMLLTRFMSNKLGAEIHTFIPNGESIFGGFWDTEEHDAMYRCTNDYSGEVRWNDHGREAMIYRFGVQSVEAFEAQLKENAQA